MALSLRATSGTGGLSSEINVTPLIDILLVMLIIFMVIVPLAPHGLNSELPSTLPSTVEEDASRRPVLVRVESGQVESGHETPQYTVDGTRVCSADVMPRLIELLSKKSIRRLLVKADAKLDFSAVAEVINAGQAAGAEGIGLVTPASGAPQR